MHAVVVVLPIVETEHVHHIGRAAGGEHAIVHAGGDWARVVERPHRAGGARRDRVTGGGALQRLFVEQRPQKHAGMIALAPHHVAQQRHIVGCRIEQAVLGHHQHAETVAGLQQFRRHCVMQTDGVAANRFQPLQTKHMQRIGQRHADASMVLMQADALDLERTSVEKNP